MVVWRGKETGNHQLPHPAAGEGRPVLRTDLRHHQGVGVLLREVQVDPVPGGDLRPLRGGGHPSARAPRAHGAHRAGGAGVAHLVLSIGPLAPGAAARSADRGAPFDSLLREVHRHRLRRHRPEADAAPHGGGIPGGARSACHELHRRHRRGGDPHPAGVARPGRAGRRSAAQDDGKGYQERQTALEAHRDRGELPRLRQRSGVDGARRHPRDPAGAAADGAAGRRPVRHLRSERPLPARDQPQQPPQAPAGPGRARHHHPQREAHAAGGGRRAVRQLEEEAGGERRGESAAEVPVGHAARQAGALPAEPAGQARRLLGPVGDRGRTGAQSPSVRTAHQDGAGAVQALHHEEAGRRRRRLQHQEGQDAGGGRDAGGVGGPGGDRQGAPGPAEPGAHAASARHPGIRTGAGGGQGDQAAPAGVRGLQRRLRRRSDGRARAAHARRPDRELDADAVESEPARSGQRIADRGADPGHDPGHRLPDRRQVGRRR